MAAVGPSKTTQHDGFVTIEVPTNGSYGIILDPGLNGKCATIKRWEKLPDGKFGPIQVHGGVRLNDVVLRVNDVDLTTLPFAQAKSVISDTNLLRKVITFGSPAKYHEILNKKAGGSLGGGDFGSGAGSGGKDFISSVRQARINKESGSDGPIAEFEVVCKLRVVTNKVQKESTLKWSVWHRYSDFAALNAQLTKELGWQLKDVKFPPKRSLVLNKLNVAFIESRRAALENWWQALLALDRIAEFNKHYASQPLKDFLEVSSVMAANKSANGGEFRDDDEYVPGASGADGGSNNGTGGGSSSNSSRNSSRRQSQGGNRLAPGTSRRSSLVSERMRQSTAAPVRNSVDPRASSYRGKSPLGGGNGNSNSGGGGGGAATPPPAAAAPKAATPAIPDEYVKFFKMLKMHIPRGAVEMKMQAEGFDPKVLDQYSDGDEDGGGGSAAPAPPPPAAVKAAPAPPPAPAPGKLPSKPSGGRANLLADIAKRRIE